MKAKIILTEGSVKYQKRDFTCDRPKNPPPSPSPSAQSQRKSPTLQTKK